MRSTPPSRRSPTPRAGCSRRSGSRSSTARTAGRPGPARSATRRPTSTRTRTCTPRSGRLASARLGSATPARCPRRSAPPRPWWIRDRASSRATAAWRSPARTRNGSPGEHGTPLFVYDRDRFAENARRLAAALDRAGLRHPAAVRAEGQPGAADPRGRSGPLRRHRRLLAGRGRRGPSSAAGGRTRSATRARTSPSGTSTCSWPRRSISTSTRSARSSGSAGGRRADDRAPHQPGRRRRLPRRASRTAASARRSSASTRSGSPRRSRRRPATT